MRGFSAVPRLLATNWPVLALVAVLTVAAIVVSPKKPFWNDELFSWHVVTADPATLMRAYNDALNNTPVLYFGLGWLWAHIFGASELSLRLFSSFGISLAALLIWPLLRRVYGFWPAALALLGVFCTSHLVFYQNAEARMYGLFLALVALAIVVFERLCRDKRPGLGLLAANAMVHAALVHTHLFGPFYSGAIALSFAASRMARDGFDIRLLPERLRIDGRVAFSFLAAWLTFLLYLPAFHAQAEAGRPYSWLPRPELADLHVLFSHASAAFLRPELLVIIILLAALSLLANPERDPALVPEARPDERPLLLLALAFLALPVAIWIAARIGRPIFFDRYLIPSLFGWVILLAHVAARILPQPPPAMGHLAITRRLLLAGIAAALLALPLIAARDYRGRAIPGIYDSVFGHADLPMVVPTGAHLLERMFYDPDNHRYFYVLDWEATARPESGRFGIQEHKHMEAWRRVFPERFANRIVDSDVFLTERDAFLVLAPSDYTRECSIEAWGTWDGHHCPQWVPYRLLGHPDFEMTELGRHSGEVFLLFRRRAEAGKMGASVMPWHRPPRHRPGRGARGGLSPARRCARQRGDL